MAQLTAVMSGMRFYKGFFLQKIPYAHYICRTDYKFATQAYSFGHRSRYKSDALRA